MSFCVFKIISNKFDTFYQEEAQQKLATVRKY